MGERNVLSSISGPGDSNETFGRFLSLLAAEKELV
jgi:hypothetical protein